MHAITVGAVAALTGVSVRHPRHCDHIELGVSSVRTPAGYRGYTDADIEQPGTEPRSSATTSAATRCTAVWWKCIWQTSDSPATTRRRVRVGTVRA